MDSGWWTHPSESIAAMHLFLSAFADVPDFAPATPGTTLASCA